MTIIDVVMPARDEAPTIACNVVVSNNGTALSSAEIRSMISVQPRMTACAPRATRLAMILR